MELLRCEKISKFYRVHDQNVPILNQIDLTIREGEFVGLIGKSGSGKSTLARVMVGLTPPCSGFVHYRGTPLSRLNHKQKMAFARDVQMIFQDPQASLNPKMCIADAITEGLLIHDRLNTTQRLQRAEEHASMVSLPSSLLRAYPRELSGGQRQRVCIARALTLQPKCLICDEAVASLDAVTKQEIVDLLVGLQKTNKLSLLFITHDVALLEQTAHPILKLENGSLLT